MLSRSAVAKTSLSMSRNTLLNRASNKRDFDYLFLRKRESGEVFYKVEKELRKFDDDKCANVFSERV